MDSPNLTSAVKTHMLLHFVNMVGKRGRKTTAKRRKTSEDASDEDNRELKTSQKKVKLSHTSTDSKSNTDSSSSPNEARGKSSKVPKTSTTAATALNNFSLVVEHWYV